MTVSLYATPPNKYMYVLTYCPSSNPTFKKELWPNKNKLLQTEEWLYKLDDWLNYSEWSKEGMRRDIK